MAGMCATRLVGLMSARQTKTYLRASSGERGTGAAVEVVATGAVSVTGATGTAGGAAFDVDLGFAESASVFSLIPRTMWSRIGGRPGFGVLSFEVFPGAGSFDPVSVDDEPSAGLEAPPSALAAGESVWACVRLLAVFGFARFLRVPRLGSTGLSFLLRRPCVRWCSAAPASMEQSVWTTVS